MQKLFADAKSEAAKKHKCPCCGYYTIDLDQGYPCYDICPVCFWEDDPIQRKDETYGGGANKVSLIEARKNYQKFGACEAAMLQYVRRPNADELTGMDE